MNADAMFQLLTLTGTIMSQLPFNIYRPELVLEVENYRVSISAPSLKP